MVAAAVVVLEPTRWIKNGGGFGADAEDSTEAHGDGSLCAARPLASLLLRSPLSSRSASPGLPTPFSILCVFSLWIFGRLPFLDCFRFCMFDAFRVWRREVLIPNSRFLSSFFFSSKVWENERKFQF